MEPSPEDCGRRTCGMALLFLISFLFSRFISSMLSRPFLTLTDHSGSSASWWISRTLPRTYLGKRTFKLQLTITTIILCIYFHYLYFNIIVQATKRRVLKIKVFFPTCQSFIVRNLIQKQCRTQ